MEHLKKVNNTRKTKTKIRNKNLQISGMLKGQYLSILTFTLLSQYFFTALFFTRIFHRIYHKKFSQGRFIVENKFSKNLFSNTNVYSATAKEKADDINKMFEDDDKSAQDYGDIKICDKAHTLSHKKLSFLSFNSILYCFPSFIV